MKTYVLEWSKKSNNFHIQPLETTLANNQKLFVDENSHDWIVLFVGERKACSQMADNWRERLIKRAIRNVC